MSSVKISGKDFFLEAFSKSVTSCFATPECGAAEDSAAYFSWRAIINAGIIVSLALLCAGCGSGRLGHYHHAENQNS
jgi:hypothetical protein